jgi:hypothetical protein
MNDREEFEKWYVNNFNRRPTEVGYETDICWQAWQAARAKKVRVPEGWKLVPVEPDEYMRNAGVSAFCGGGKVFQAMVNAAPQPPQEGE